MPVNKDAQDLKELTDQVSGSKRPVTSFGMEMMELTLLLRRLAGRGSEYDSLKGLNSPTTTQTGVALDPWQASMALDDRGRTAAFIRGSVRAVESVLRMRPDSPVRLLEAGCGPLATLSTPLMARFGPEQLKVTLVDLHQESIDSARGVIEQLGLSAGLDQAICGDLMAMGVADSFDVVVLETMAAALYREPQVALMRHLARALPSALILPENIGIDLQLIDPRRETRSIPPVPADRQPLGKVYELNRTSAMDGDLGDTCLPAATLQIPESVAPGRGLFLTTTVEIFDQVSIADYDAQITLPFGIPNADSSWLGREIQFRYRIGDLPQFEWALRQPGQ